MGVFFFKQKTAYEITYGDWSSDVCSSDLVDTVVVRSKRIKLQRGISHAGEFLGPRSELFWSDALVVPAVGVDANPVSVHAPDELVYWSPEVLASNVPAGDIERAEGGG